MTVIGVDPGIHGALSLIVDGCLVGLADMPTVTVKVGPDKLVFNSEGVPIRRHQMRDRVSATALVALIRGWQDDWRDIVKAFVERVHAHENDSAASAFQFGRATGEVIGVLAALGVNIVEVSPQRWKKAMACDADKKKSRRRAQQIFPTSAVLFAAAKNDGAAEAALIGAYGYRTLG